MDRIKAVEILQSMKDGNVPSSYSEFCKEYNEKLDGIIELIMNEKYPEIEKIFIDFDIYIHGMRLDEETLKMNPLTANYQEGYRQCYKDLQNRIIELIRKNKEVVK